MLESKKENVNVVFLKDVGIIKSISPTYVINEIKYEEQKLIAELKKLKNDGFGIREIMKLTNLNKISVEYYLRKKDYQISEDGQYFDINYMPLIYRPNKNEIIDNVCYDFDSLPKNIQEIVENYCRPFIRSENGLYELGERAYKVKKKTTKI